MKRPLVEGNGIRFSDLYCGQKEGHRILLPESQQIREFGAKGPASLTRCWNVGWERMDVLRPTIEQNVGRLGLSLVSFVVDIVEERTKDSIGLTHRTLADTFPDGKIAGVPYIAVGYDYLKKDPDAKASWANQLNTGLALAREVGATSLIPLTTEVEVLHDLPDGPTDNIISCRLDKNATTNNRLVFEQALEALIVYVENGTPIDKKHLPHLAMIQRNTLRVVGLDALRMTNGWDPACDPRGGMEDHLHWFAYLFMKERGEPGWCRRNLPLIADERWLFYTEARNGVSPYEKDPDKLGRELSALGHVFEDVNARRLVVPAERSFFVSV